jgi:tetratricopeptide (TPR) repeat protein
VVWRALTRAEGKLAEALAAAQRALEIDRSSGGRSANSLVTADLSIIAGILQAQGKNEEAERAVNQATELAGPNPNPAIKVVLLLIFGSIYKSDGRLLEAEVPLPKALKICSPGNTQASPVGSCAAVQEILSDVYRKEGKAFDADQMTSTKLDNATSNLNNLDRRAQQYMDDGHYAESETAYRQIIESMEGNPTAETTRQAHPGAKWWDMLPGEYYSLGKALQINRDAETEFKKSIDARRKLHQLHPNVLSNALRSSLSALWVAYHQQGRFNELEPLMQEAVGIQEKGDSSNDMAKAAMVRMLAEMYAEEGTSDISKYAQAAHAYEHALEILGAVDSKQESLDTLTQYLRVLHALHDVQKAAEIQARIDRLTGTPTQR